MSLEVGRCSWIPEVSGQETGGTKSDSKICNFNNQVDGHGDWGGLEEKVV